jgi:hypothetical protein
LVGTAREVDVHIIIAKDEVHFTGRAGSVAAMQFILAPSLQRNLRHIHDFPNVDDHFRMSDQEGKHLGIAVDRFGGHTPKITGIYHDCFEASTCIRRQLLKRNSLDCGFPRFSSGSAFAFRLEAVRTELFASAR